MKSFDDIFSTDGDLEKGAGVDLDYGEAGTITIHRAGGANKKFARIFSARMKPYERQLASGTLDDEVANKVMAEVYADAVIIGWRGVHRGGKQQKFTRENAIKLLLQVPELFRDIQEQASKVANFRQVCLEEAAKNSETPSEAR